MPAVPTLFCVAMTMNGLGRQVGVPIHGDLSLFHRFQKGGLRFAGCAVDLVAQKQIGVRHGAGAVDEFAALPVIDGEADDIGGKHVRRELNTVEIKPQRTAERDGERRFADARHVVQQDMPLGKQCHENLLDDAALADDGFSISERMDSSCRFIVYFTVMRPCGAA